VSSQKPGTGSRIRPVIPISKKELRDDTKDSSYYAAGLATYSNSKSIISSYASIFESLWKQNELYEQLKIHDKMQQEFINVAAHELRTPYQSILGLADILHSEKIDGAEDSNLPSSQRLWIYVDLV